MKRELKKLLLQRLIARGEIPCAMVMADDWNMTAYLDWLLASDKETLTA